MVEARRNSLKSLFVETRQKSVQLCESLQTEDFVVQSMEDVSPIKWHLGHTTWFYEKVILCEHQKNYQPYDQDYLPIFNSYYQTFGSPWVRSQRGILSRPTVDETLNYRHEIDRRMQNWIDSANLDGLQLLEIGLHHEMQHQELMLMDIKHIFSCNPLNPKFAKIDERNQFSKNAKGEKSTRRQENQWLEILGGVHSFGVENDNSQFAYDNESPVHKVHLEDYSISLSLVTNQDYLNFIIDGGYKNFRLWHAEAWDKIQSQSISQPMYWRNQDNSWSEFTLYGEQPLTHDRPVSHINYYEACAYAEWAGMRLPNEFEWELAASSLEKEISSANGFLDNQSFHPGDQSLNSDCDFFGQLWQWTSSSYSAYPGYKPPAGALGEYNSKFMINQQVLRGGSFATTKAHYRPTYRNFFQPEKAWAFTGLRCAKL